MSVVRLPASCDAGYPEPCMYPKETKKKGTIEFKKRQTSPFSTVTELMCNEKVKWTKRLEKLGGPVVEANRISDEAQSSSVVRLIPSVL
jgi:hypothetical protein